jgi:Mrp family chromosome partitioning ATPase
MDLLRPPLQSTPPDEGDAVNGIAARIYRRRRLFAWIFGLVFLPSLLAVAVWPPIYFASGTVIVGEQEPTSSAASPAWIQKLGDPADLESQLLIIRSHRMLRLALARAGVLDAVLRECRSHTGLGALLRRGPNCAELEPGSQQLREYVEQRYSARAIGRSRIIAIGYESALPDVAFMMANALVLTYLEDQRAENARGREASAAWLLREAKRLDPVPAADAQPVDSSNPEAAANQSRQKFLMDVYSKASDLETERRTLLSGARLVSLAEVPKSPYFPKKAPLLVAGLTIAVILGSLVALHRDTTDPTLRRPRELELLTKSDVLAKVPYLELPDRAASAKRRRPVQARRRASKHRAVAGKPPPHGTSVAVEGDIRAAAAERTQGFAHKTPNKKTTLGALVDLGAVMHSVSEEIRNLLARLLLHTDRDMKRILVVSASRGEGKSFTALSLARVAAESGRKVLLVDCNFRQPAIAASLGVAAESGLADVLRGDVDAGQATSPTALAGLDILAAGADRRSSSLLLIDGNLAEIMRQSEPYDLVILDGPSADCSPDAGILAKHADGVLVCAQWGSAVPGHVKNLIDGMRRERVNVLGVIVTMVQPSELRWYERNLGRA